MNEKTQALHGSEACRRALLAIVVMCAAVLGPAEIAGAAPTDAPTIISVTPTHGDGAGGTPVIITGSGFLPGNTVVNFGASAVTPLALTPTQINVTAPGGSMTVPLWVTAGGVDSAKTTFTFDTPSGPSVTSVSPNAGPPAGGTQLTINGSGFVFYPSGVVAFESASGSRVQVACGNAAATTPNCYSDTTSRVKVIQPALAPGTYHVRVTITGSGAGTTTAATFADTFTVGGPGGGGGPTVSSIDPKNAPAAGSTLTQVTIVGSGFCEGTTDTSPCPSTSGTKVKFGDVEATRIQVVNRTMIRAYAPAHDVGTVNVQVLTASGVSANNLTNDDFTFDPCAQTTVDRVSPSTGFRSGGGAVTISGCGFTGVKSNAALYGVRFGTAPATITGTPTETSITVSVPAGTADGPVPVVVTTPQGSSTGQAASQYTYTTPPPPAPTHYTIPIGMITRE